MYVNIYIYIYIYINYVEQQVYKLVNDVKQINEEMRQFKDDIRAIKMVMSNVNNNVNINIFSFFF